MEKVKFELETYKKQYYKNNPTSSKEEETRDVLKKADEYIRTVLPTVHEINQKSLLLYESGRLYNVLEEHNATAEQFLSMSIRMNPKNPETWHELGQCVLKRHDLEFAQSCFRISLKLKRSAPALTSLAVTMRLVALNVPEPSQTDMRTKAMDLLIEARRLDNSYGPAHLAFATGLFYCFFSTGKVELHFLEKVIENYKKALECETTKTDPQVYINMATCLKFMERYEEAVEAYRKAVEYDSRNEFETEEKLKSCTDYLIRFADEIRKNGKVKAKRLQEMVVELQKGQNSTDCFRAKIIGTVGHEETIPVALVCVDSSGEVYGLTVYNCLADFGFVLGDTISVAKPDYRRIENLELDGISAPISLKWVRVGSPIQIKKNGVALPESVLARAVASTHTK